MRYFCCSLSYRPPIAPLYLVPNMIGSEGFASWGCGRILKLLFELDADLGPRLHDSRWLIGRKNGKYDVRPVVVCLDCGMSI